MPLAALAVAVGRARSDCKARLLASLLIMAACEDMGDSLVAFSVVGLGSL